MLAMAHKTLRLGGRYWEWCWIQAIGVTTRTDDIQTTLTCKCTLQIDKTTSYKQVNHISQLPRAFSDLGKVRACTYRTSAVGGICSQTVANPLDFILTERLKTPDTCGIEVWIRRLHIPAYTWNRDRSGTWTAYSFWAPQVSELRTTVASCLKIGFKIQHLF